MVGRAETFGRFLDHTGRAHYARVEGEFFAVLDAAPWDGGGPTGERVRRDAVELLPAADPGTIIGLAGAYADPATAPKSLRWFAKSASAAATDGTPVEIPSAVDALKVEVELVIVIGRRVREASEAEAEAAIFGYATGTEIFGYADAFHRRHGEEPRSEGMLAAGLKLGDHFAPFGPFIVTDYDWRDRARRLRVVGADGRVREHYEGSTTGLLHPPAKIVRELSRVQTLQPGDLIFTGTSQAFVVHAGETVETEIEGLGVLRNPILSPSNP